MGTRGAQVMADPNVRRHALKTKPVFYQAVADGLKTFEVRFNDRCFEAGDTLALQEWEGTYSGRELEVTVTYVLGDPDYVKPGYVILGFKL
jgi:hypothetical protein